MEQLKSNHLCWFHTSCIDRWGFPPLLLLSHRGVHSFLRWQHVHEGGDANNHAHGGRGRLAALSLPEGLWPPHGDHITRLSRHTQDRAGWRPRQTYGQLRYRMLPPPLHPHPSASTPPSLPIRWLTMGFLTFLILSIFPSVSSLNNCIWFLCECGYMRPHKIYYITQQLANVWANGFSTLTFVSIRSNYADLFQWNRTQIVVDRAFETVTMHNIM